MTRLFTSFALLLALAGCPGTPAVDQDIPEGAPYARVVAADDAGAFDVRFGHMADLQSFGLVVHVEGGTIASWERDDTALKSAGGQVLPLRANATDTELELMVGTTKPVTIADEADIAHLVIEPTGDVADVAVTLEMSGKNQGAIQRSGHAFDLHNLSAALN